MEDENEIFTVILALAASESVNVHFQCQIACFSSLLSEIEELEGDL